METAPNNVVNNVATPKEGGGGGSGTSSPGSRFKVDLSNIDSPLSNHSNYVNGTGAPAPPPLSTGTPPPSAADTPPITSPSPPPPPPVIGNDIKAPTVAAESNEVLSPGSQEGEISLPIIELPDGNL